MKAFLQDRVMSMRARSRMFSTILVAVWALGFVASVALDDLSFGSLMFWLGAPLLLTFFQVMAQPAEEATDTE